MAVAVANYPAFNINGGITGTALPTTGAVGLGSNPAAVPTSFNQQHIGVPLTHLGTARMTAANGGGYFDTWYDQTNNVIYVDVIS